MSFFLSVNDDFVNSVSERYIELYESVSGETFVKSDISDPQERIESNVLGFLNKVMAV